MKGISTFLAVFSVCVFTALGDDIGKQSVPPAVSNAPFERGTWEAEGGAGFFGSFSTTSVRRITINYQIEDLRLGWMYDSPRHPGIFRGNNEFLLEVFAGPVTKGPGSFIAGGSPLWRYNFVQPGAKLIPYVQLGAGALDNDSHVRRSQRELGEAFEFVLQADVGLKYLINDKWAISAEVDFRHISNADLAGRNEGLNSLGGLMQLSYSFP